jgi:tRNA(Glu) U13 pseudouridine synthase TruD
VIKFQQLTATTLRFSGRRDVPLLEVDGSFRELTVIEEGDAAALLVQFSLPAGSYATMALREMLKL